MVKWMSCFEKRCIIFEMVLCALILNPVVSFTTIKAEDNLNRLSLQESITIALDGSTFVKSAQESLHSADYERKAALTEFFPKLGTYYNYTRYNEPPHMKTPPGDPYEYPTDIPLGRKNRYQWNIYLTQPIFTGGAISSSYEIAYLNKQMAGQNLTAAQQDTVLQVKEAYFNILKAEKIRLVAEQALIQVQSHLDDARAFYQEEMIPRNDLLEAQVRHAQAKQDLIHSQNTEHIARAHFNTVLRRDISTPVAIEDILTEPAEEFFLDDCLKEARQQRPELREAELHIEQKEKTVRYEQSSYFPQIALVADYQKMGDQVDLKGNPYEDSESWRISGVLKWEFWEWGKKHYRISSRRAELQRARERKTQIDDVIAFEVKQSWLRLNEAQNNIAVAQNALEQSRENFRLNRELFREQMANTTDVLDAQTLMNEAFTNYYNALSNYYIARSRLEYAMGRRWGAGDKKYLQHTLVPEKNICTTEEVK
jgi:outer membrane protein TolC